MRPSSCVPTQRAGWSGGPSIHPARHLVAAHTLARHPEPARCGRVSVLPSPVRQACRCDAGLQLSIVTAAARCEWNATNDMRCCAPGEGGVRRNNRPRSPISRPQQAQPPSGAPPNRRAGGTIVPGTAVARAPLDRRRHRWGGAVLQQRALVPRTNAGRQGRIDTRLACPVSPRPAPLDALHASAPRNHGGSVWQSRTWIVQWCAA